MGMTSHQSDSNHSSVSNDIKSTLRVGFLINPYAGIGGPAGFKGSDLIELQSAAAQGKIPLRAPARAHTFWRLIAQALEASAVTPLPLGIEVISAPQQMGADWLSLWGVAHTVVSGAVNVQTTAQDTQVFAQAIQRQGVDILVFAGGDGTARDIYRAVGSEQLVLGIPSGVKMHSGVYAINPQCAAELMIQLLSGVLMSTSLQEVRDIDENEFRQGRVKAQYFGEMPVPAAAEYVQAVKQGGMESEALVLFDIAEYLREHFSPDALIVWAPGSTTLGLLKEWGHEGTLLGVDVLMPSGDLVRDVNAQQLNALAADHTGVIELVVTAIGGQGHIIGRGNQQITPELLKRIGKEHVNVVATKTKLRTLHGRPLLLDSGCAELDELWAGLIPVNTGYDDVVLYPVGRLPKDTSDDQK